MLLEIPKFIRIRILGFYNYEKIEFCIVKGDNEKNIDKFT